MPTIYGNSWDGPLVAWNHIKKHMKDMKAPTRRAQKGAQPWPMAHPWLVVSMGISIS